MLFVVCHVLFSLSRVRSAVASSLRLDDGPAKPGNTAPWKKKCRSQFGVAVHKWADRECLVRFRV